MYEKVDLLTTRKKEFERRFNLATGGAFKNVDLRRLGAAVTGSILIPCVHTSPLEKGFEDVDWNLSRMNIKTPCAYMVDHPETQEDRKFLHYLEYFYPSYVSLKDSDYQKQVIKIDSSEQPNLQKDSISYESDESNLSALPSAIVDKMEINELKVRDTIELSAIDVDVDVDDCKDIDESTTDTTINTTAVGCAALTFCATGTDANTTNTNTNTTTKPPKLSKPPRLSKKDKKDKKDKNKPTTLNATETENKSIRGIEYNQLADIDISITSRDFDTFKKNALELYEAIKKNCEHRGDVYIKEVKTLSQIKYKIFGPGIPRPMDIFRIPYDPVKMVKKFHVHAVKMYYDNEVTMFRSCVACLLSGVGENYKWFSCNKVAADVLLKYAQRGFSIILNKKERDAISKYIVENERWGSMLKYINADANKIYCCVTADHPFFKPGLYDSGVRMSLRKFERDCNGQYTSSLVVTIPTTKFPFGELCIKENNKLYPPNSSIINACLDYIESQSVEDEDE